MPENKNNTSPAIEDAKAALVERLKSIPVRDRRQYNELLAVDEDSVPSELAWRWVNVNDKANLSRRRMQGYDFARVEHGVRTVSGITDDAGDGTIRVGDVVLMVCHKEHVERRKKQRLEEAESKLQSHMDAEEFEAAATKVGRPVKKEVSVRKSQIPME